MTLHEAIKAADALAADGINARVIDLYSVKPVDTETLLGGHRPRPAGGWSRSRTTGPRAASATPCSSAFADADERPRVVKLAVTHLPGSGKGAELLHDCGIDADAIVAAAKRLVALGPQLSAAPTAA